MRGKSTSRPAKGKKVHSGPQAFLTIEPKISCSKKNIPAAMAGMFSAFQLFFRSLRQRGQTFLSLYTTKSLLLSQKMQLGRNFFNTIVDPST